MIRELINFTKNLDEDFKNLGSLPKEGLHILLKLKTGSDSIVRIDSDNIKYEQYSKKSKNEVSEFLNQCKLLHQNAWCIDTNKCFDLPTKAIHTCSPYAVAFKREHLKGGIKYIENEKSKKKQIYDRFGEYFAKAFLLLDGSEKSQMFIPFKHFFVNRTFVQVLEEIDKENEVSFQVIDRQIDNLKEELKSTNDKERKGLLKDSIAILEQQLLKVKPLEESSYIIFYLDLSLEEYQAVHKKYLDDKLFNTDKYNTAADENGLIYGTSNFMNGFNGNMPFLLHQTATFDITGRISNVDAKLLNDLKNLLPNKTLPNPLPIFVYKDEVLQKELIKIYSASGFKLTYREMVQEILSRKDTTLSNYYLLFWGNTKDGIVFKDFDYVSKFDYKIGTLIIHNLFAIKEKGGKTDKHYSRIETIFDLERQVLQPLIQSKYQRVDFFGDLNKEDYAKLDRTYDSYSKYRKAVYDFVYKSQRQSIDGNIFYELVFNSVLDNVKNGNDYGVKEKLNIWYSLYDYFNSSNKINMVNKLKEYQDFVTTIISDEELIEISDEKFAFAAGQVIEYILSKSKSADTSYNLLEPYLQQSKCSEFKKAIANDFGRYKHEKFSSNFEKVAAFVLSYETSTNLKHLLPQILSGVFAKNQLFSSNPSK